MKVLKYIPNTLTSINLICGFIAILLAFDPIYLPIAPWFVFIAAVFDFTDGFAARMFKAYSELGKQLDSLADMVSFGVAPGVIIYKLLLFSNFVNAPSLVVSILFMFFAAMIPVFSALRLAKFNIDERQTSSFIGLPTPASAILIASITLAFFNTDNLMVQYIIVNRYSLTLLIIFDCFLMISELPMFSLKMKSMSFVQHKTQYIFLITSIFLLVFLKILAIPLVIFFYILISVGIFLFNRKRA